MTKKPVKKKRAKKPVKTGRPSLYQPEFETQAEKLCLLGATDAQMADFFGVSVATLNNWKKQQPEFLESIKKGKAMADATVAQSLFKRATGYSHQDVHISNYQGDVTITDITKHYPPETAAGIFWLKNRQPEMWRDKQQPVKVPMGDNLAEAGSAVLNAVGNGKLTPTEASQLLQAISVHARITELEELEKRLSVLEERLRTR